MERVTYASGSSAASSDGSGGGKDTEILKKLSSLQHPEESKTEANEVRTRMLLVRRPRRDRVKSVYFCVC